MSEMGSQAAVEGSLMRSPDCPQNQTSRRRRSWSARGQIQTLLVAVPSIVWMISRFFANRKTGARGCDADGNAEGFPDRYPGPRKIPNPKGRSSEERKYRKNCCEDHPGSTAKRGTNNAWSNASCGECKPREDFVKRLFHLTAPSLSCATAVTPRTGRR